jgi:hypothetical protein
VIMALRTVQASAGHPQRPQQNALEATQQELQQPPKDKH